MRFVFLKKRNNLKKEAEMYKVEYQKKVQENLKLKDEILGLREELLQAQSERDSFQRKFNLLKTKKMIDDDIEKPKKTTTKK